MQDGMDEKVEPGAACLQVSEPRCGNHSAFERLCPCMGGESLRLTCESEIKVVSASR